MKNVQASVVRYTAAAAAARLLAHVAHLLLQRPRQGRRCHPNSDAQSQHTLLAAKATCIAAPGCSVKNRKIKAAGRIERWGGKREKEADRKAANGKVADEEAASLDGKRRFTFLQEAAGEAADGEMASLAGKRGNR
ncbi:hypothetical protein E2562_035360 [Oryza meyeriana var. granulata]|uniref:Uncharacterized protein n=1 Tax=Oryza meyeriana var. granulata TaxID=110450 RepID=A0A6G1BPS4_9ORYZ|nr:hypothetical protein E2562_035360 [Oryza meyeriana var. granulata]